jgi:hypothetical protein
MVEDNKELREKTEELTRASLLANSARGVYAGESFGGCLGEAVLFGCSMPIRLWGRFALALL